MVFVAEGRVEIGDRISILSVVFIDCIVLGQILVLRVLSSSNCIHLYTTASSLHESMLKIFESGFGCDESIAWLVDDTSWHLVCDHDHRSNTKSHGHD